MFLNVNCEVTSIDSSSIPSDFTYYIMSDTLNVDISDKLSQEPNCGYSMSQTIVWDGVDDHDFISVSDDGILSI